MNVRLPEQAFPPYEPAAGYFAPPPALVTGNEWRLIQPLRDAAASKNASSILAEAIVAQYQHHLSPSLQNLGMAFADLAVAGRAAFADFTSLLPQETGPLGAAAMALLASRGIPAANSRLLQVAVAEVLDRAYQVVWFLRGQAPRGNLGWIAVSGEDDLPHRPVNVPSSKFPQGELVFTVPGALGAVAVRTRYIIASSSVPAVPAVSFPRRDLPPVFEPSLPANDQLIIFLHGSDSRLEEASEIIPKLVRLPDGQPSGFTVVSLDLPGSGYVNQIDHTEVGPWTPANVTIWPLPTFGVGSVKISLLPFLENFIVGFVGALSSRLGQVGLVESRVIAVMGGSLGGNLALRLARRPEPWIRNAIAFSPGSVWRAAGPLAPGDPSAAADAALLQAGVTFAIPSAGQVETPLLRDQFFAGAFDQHIPVKTQPEQWFRDGWPAKMQAITNARLDRREIYTSQYRRWHWRVSLEELLWSWQDAAVQNFRARLLLGAGSEDDIIPAHIFSNTQKLAVQVLGLAGDSFFFQDTGHSIHSERPDALARKIIAFLTHAPVWNWLNLGKPATANIRGIFGVVTVMDNPTAPQRPHAFVEGNDYNLWCLWSNGSTLSWTNMLKPTGVNLLGFAGIVTAMVTPSAAQRIHLFLTGNDGNLWLRWSDSMNWHWDNLFKPQGVNLRGRLGAVTVMSTPTSAQRPHVFFEGVDYNVWCVLWDGAAWQWKNLGKPATANVIGSVGAVSVMDNPSAPQRPHVFVTGNDGNIWCLWSDGTDWHWRNMFTPTGTNVRGLLGATFLMDTPASPQRPHVFVECTDQNVWCLWSDAMDWHWINMSKPPTANVVGLVGAMTVIDPVSTFRKPHLVISGNDGNVWLLTSSGGPWTWANLGKPPTAALNGLQGVATVMDTPTSDQRPHLFVEGSDGNMWVDFWA